jgi:hypothetical protein
LLAALSALSVLLHANKNNPIPIITYFFMLY